jgi:hypothetical protein
MPYDDGMVNSPAQSLEKFIVRLPEGMRDAIGIAARKNGRSMNAEIVARLSKSFGMAEPETEPGEVPTSPTARDALALAKSNDARINVIEDAVSAVCDHPEIIEFLPYEVGRILIELSKRLGGGS